MVSLSLSKVSVATTTDEKRKAVLQLENDGVLYLNNTGSYRALSSADAGIILINLKEWEKAKLRIYKAA